MIIQQYEMFLFHKVGDLILAKAITETTDNIFYIKVFLTSCFGHIGRHNVLNFIEKMKTIYKDGVGFEVLSIDIDNQNDLVYFSESYYSYKSKPTTPEIEKLLDEDNLIQLCKMEFLEHIIMTKENFIHLLVIWDEILDQFPPFALLYEDDKNWYDVLPFDSQEAMEKFVADHSQQKMIQK